jgi:hypothetical protein
MKRLISRPGAEIRSSRWMSKVKRTSSAVTGSPSDQRASGRRWNVITRPSAEVSQLVASDGRNVGGCSCQSGCSTIRLGNSRSITCIS